MIYVSDRFDLVPELFDNFTDIVKSDSANIDVLPVSDPEITDSSNFTVFIQPEPDMHINHIDFSKHITARPNHIFAVSGFNLNSEHDWKNPYFLNFAHLSMTHRVNSTVPSVQLGPKKFAGTLLLGGRTTNRNIIIKEFWDSGLLDNFIVSYFKRSFEPNAVETLFYRSPELDLLDDPEFVKRVFNANGTGNTAQPGKVCKFGQHQWLSQHIAYDVYNSAYISVVAETESYCDSFFVTEKLSKPLLLGQPFIMFNGQHSLKILREQGFKTFSPWINESYDDIQEPMLRARAVAQSALEFARLSDKQKIDMLVEMQPVVEHNKKLATDYSWLFGTLADVIRQHHTLDVNTI